MVLREERFERDSLAASEPIRMCLDRMRVGGDSPRFGEARARPRASPRVAPFESMLSLRERGSVHHGRVWVHDPVERDS